MRRDPTTNCDLFSWLFACFPVLGADCMFSPAWHLFHFFLRLALVAFFPVLDSGYMFSHAWQWLYVCTLSSEWFFALFDWPNVVNCDCCVSYVFWISGSYWHWLCSALYFNRMTCKTLIKFRSVSYRWVSIAILAEITKALVSTETVGLRWWASETLSNLSTWSLSRWTLNYLFHTTTTYWDSV